MRQRATLKAKAILGRANKMLLGRHVRAVQVDAGDLLLLVDPEDLGVGRHLRRTGAYESDELERLLNFVDSESRVLIVGSHIGAIALPLARKAKSVDAVEANPSTFALLESNVAVNSLRNVHTHHFAAAEEAGTIDFLMSRANSGGSKIKPAHHDYRYTYDSPETVAVPKYALDQYFDNETFDLILMDIEGSEYSAIRGAQRLLENATIFIVEFVPHHLQNVAAVTVEQFASSIPHFDFFEVPSLGTTYPHERLLSALSELYQTGAGDDGIVFRRGRPTRPLEEPESAQIY